MAFFSIKQDITAAISALIYKLSNNIVHFMVPLSTTKNQAALAADAAALTGGNDASFGEVRVNK